MALINIIFRYVHKQCCNTVYEIMKVEFVPYFETLTFIIGY